MAKQTVAWVFNELHRLSLFEEANNLLRDAKEKGKNHCGAREIVEALTAAGFPGNKLEVLERLGYKKDRDSIIATLKKEGLL